METSIRNSLLAWFRREKRQLPWRGTTDPYRIWVSEVMLQQTTVAAVRPRYDAFLERFPDVSTLADASEDSVLAAWSGLGYYARARNLRRAAQIVVRDHEGRIPDDPLALRSLPGFGEYMSAAVASLAFGSRLPAADANVDRVLSRVFVIRGRTGTRAHRLRVLEAADRILPSRRAGDLTAALMDLGQTVCTPRAPRCPECPIRTSCVAYRTGTVSRYPEKKAKEPFVDVPTAAAAAVSGGRALLVRREAGWLSGMWEFPSAAGASPAAARRALRARLAELGLGLDRGAPLGSANHTIARRRLAIRVFPASERRGTKRRSSADVGWFSGADLENAAVPTLTRKIARACGLLPARD